MLFIAIGLIILFISFFAALVMLIRELGQRVNIDDSINDFPLDLATEVIPEESSSFDSVNMAQDQQLNSLPQEDRVSRAPSLDEVVPFPWDMEVDIQSSRVESEKPQETEIVSNEPLQGLSSSNLNDNFYVSDLVNKD